MVRLWEPEMSSREVAWVGGDGHLLMGQEGAKPHSHNLCVVLISK